MRYLRMNTKSKLIRQLNSNLNFLLKNPKGANIDQLMERLDLIDQSIDQTLLLILLEEKERNQNCH